MSSSQKSLLSQASLLCDLLAFHGECAFIFNGVLVKIYEDPDEDFQHIWETYENSECENYTLDHRGHLNGTVFNIIDTVVHMISTGEYDE